MTTKCYVSATQKLDKENEKGEEQSMILQARKHSLKNNWFRSQRAEESSDWVSWKEHNFALKKPLAVQAWTDLGACEVG